MKRSISPGWLGVLVLLVVLIAGGGLAQLQQSGGAGSTVTANAGANLNTSALALESGGNLATVAGAITSAKMQGNVAQINGVTPLMGPGNGGTGSLRVNIATDQLAVPVSGTVNTIPKTACGNTLATGSIIAAIPTSATLVTSAATACVTRVLFSNNNAGAGTVTLTDNTATPLNVMLTFSIPGFSDVILPLDGIGFNLGVKWTASGTGFTGAVVAYQ